MTEFKVGDRVRHRASPSIEGEVHSVYFDGAVEFFYEGEPVAYFPSELELVEPSEDEWKQVAEDVKVSENDQLLQNMRDLFDEAYELFASKNADYGSKAIANAPGGALNGIMVRKHDKMERLRNLIENNKVERVAEKKEETLLDDGVFSFMAVLVERGQWPGA